METLFSDDRGDPCVWIVLDRLEFYPCDRDDRKSHRARLYLLMETGSNDPYVRSDMTYHDIPPNFSMSVYKKRIDDAREVCSA